MKRSDLKVLIKEIISVVQENESVKIDRISPKERNLISKEFSKVGLDGNGRFASLSQGLHAITNVLSSFGFNLDMVTGDSILGDNGVRNLFYRRANDEGADPFTEKPEIKNSRISFSWHNFSTSGQPPRYEILAYPT